MKQLLERQMSLAEHARVDYVGKADPGTTIDDVMKEDFWAHTAKQFKPFDRVEVRCVDGSWMAELIVLACGFNWAKMYKASFYEFDSKVEFDADGPVVIEFAGPVHRWRIKRKSDNEVLEKGFTSRDDAASWWEKNGKMAA